MTLPLIAQNQNEELVSVFPDLGMDQIDDNGFNFTKQYYNNPSSWFVEKKFSEKTVFHAELKYTSEYPSLSYSMRIGKGGQIYSLRNRGIGEAIPPQHRDGPREPSYFGQYYAPWVDEVWQLVTVDLNQKNSTGQKWFIHQSGVYLHQQNIQKRPFFSPLLAEYYDEANQAYTVVNWGQQAHTKVARLRNFTSNILYYARYKNIGEGIIQVDYKIYNFGDDEITWANVPWGGARTSRLKYAFFSKPNHGRARFTADFKLGRKRIASNTGGWGAFSKSGEKGQGPTLALVVGNDNNGRDQENLWRYGFTDRDYTAMTYIRRLSGEDAISFGESANFRIFFVLGSSYNNARSRILAKKLLEKTVDTVDNWEKEEAVTVKYEFHKNVNNIISYQKVEGDDGLELKAQPYKNSYPVFLVRNRNNVQKITSDPYFFSKLPYDGKLRKMELLGFNDHKVDADVVFTSVERGENITFGDDHTVHNVQEDFIYTTENIGDDGVASLVITNVSVVESSNRVAEKEKLSFIVFPNPAESNISLKFNDTVYNNESVGFYDISGNNITSSVKLINKIEDDSLSYDISLLGSGIYFIKINDDVVKFFKR
ncbi:T9SS type A sorting domain-containing protein [Joostella sp.]|uniref:T9SS type A sorting domain-containing protein n=1 Tax=Joostella sp. TaxID=2231138 RepID=UPI003A932D8C